MKRPLAIAGIVGTAFLIRAIGAVDVPAPAPILPSATDPAIKEFNDPHLVYVNPKAKRRNELLIFIPGTGGKPGGTNQFCWTAADLGYDVIGLAYPSSIPATVVRNQKDKDAFLNFRLEIIEGRPLSTFVEVDRTNSIENRLIKVLQHLSKTKPGENWGQYLTASGQPNWPKIAVSGHSQGAGHAYLIATRHRVARAVMTGGPKDFDRNLNRPAALYSPTPATPMSGFFTFNHEQDQQGCDYQEQLLVFKAMGLDKVGAPVSVDTEKTPFKSSRILTTNHPGTPQPSAKAHSSVIGDAAGPKNDDGTMRFKPVWIYMFTAPVK